MIFEGFVVINGNLDQRFKNLYREKCIFLWSEIRTRDPRTRPYRTEPYFKTQTRSATRLKIEIIGMIPGGGGRPKTTISTKNEDVQDKSRDCDEEIRFLKMF